MKRAAVVLLSAGLDSSVNLFAAHKNEEVVLALTFDYGQRAAVKEIEHASELAAFLGVRHQVVDLKFFTELGHSSLIDKTKLIPVADEVEIDDLTTSLSTAKSVWVPNRNGIFLNIAAGYAEALNAEVIIPGFNVEEAATFPDNTNEFMQALTSALAYSTANKVKVDCYTVQMKKAEIVQMGVALGVPFEKIWPCYFAKDEWCGQCESCLRAKRAFQQNGLEHLFKGA